MGATPRQWTQTLQERQGEVPYGAVSYGPVYRVLLSMLLRRRRPEDLLNNLRSPAGVSERVAAFRRAACTHAEWFASEVVPRVRAVIQTLDGDRRSSSPSFAIEGQPISGGPHCLVQWEDGSYRLLYIVGPGWTQRRIRNMLALLQMYARDVYQMLATTVVVVDLQRHSLIELSPLDPTDEQAARATVRRLLDYLSGRAAS